jgi:hypothetical protein
MNMSKKRTICAGIALAVAAVLCTAVAAYWVGKDVNSYGIVAECLIYSAGVAAIWACTDDVLKGREQ